MLINIGQDLAKLKKKKQLRKSPNLSAYRRNKVVSLLLTLTVAATSNSKDDKRKGTADS